MRPCERPLTSGCATKSPQTTISARRETCTVYSVPVSGLATASSISMVSNPCIRTSVPSRTKSVGSQAPSALQFAPGGQSASRTQRLSVVRRLGQWDATSILSARHATVVAQTRRVAVWLAMRDRCRGIRIAMDSRFFSWIPSRRPRAARGSRALGAPLTRAASGPTAAPGVARCLRAPRARP